MELSFEEVGLIFRQAQTGRAAGEATWRVTFKARLAITERILAAMGLKEEFRPEVGGLLERINWMVNAATFYAQKDANLVLTDLAPEMLQLLAVFREMTEFVDSHWDTLPDGERKRRTDRRRVKDDLLLIDVEIAKCKAGWESSNTLTIYTGWLEDMRDSGLSFFCLMLGEGRTRQMLTSMNQAFNHLRTHSQIAQLTEDMPPSSGRPS